MWKLTGRAEIRISREELHEALRFWMKDSNFTCGDKCRLVSFSLHPDADYVVRLSLEPIAHAQIVGSGSKP